MMTAILHIRKRTVFGRRREMIDGAEYRFELREHGLYVRRKWGRKWKRVSFTDLLAVSDGQAMMRF